MKRFHGSAMLRRHARPVRTDLELPAGEAWSSETPRGGVDIACDRGTLWITVEGDPEDHVVVAPHHFEAAHGRVAALALENSHLAVSPRHG